MSTSVFIIWKNRVKFIKMCCQWMTPTTLNEKSFSAIYFFFAGPPIKYQFSYNKSSQMKWNNQIPYIENWFLMFDVLYIFIISFHIWISTRNEPPCVACEYRGTKERACAFLSPYITLDRTIGKMKWKMHIGINTSRHTKYIHEEVLCTQ